MKIISWNVNGIRAVERKGELENLLNTYNPDVFLIQETKMQIEQAKPFLKKYTEYEQYYHQAEKKGYSGTAIWVRHSFLDSIIPALVRRGGCPESQKDTDTTQSTAKDKTEIKFTTSIPNFNDTEGRISRIDIGNTTILGVYFPNGGKSPEAWEGKLAFYEQFLTAVNALREEGKNVIWAGDINCAHEEIDLARPKDNETSIGFLPEERAWITKVIANQWVDVFRKKYPEKIIYSWWHVITRARERNVGWRIDYFFVDQKLLPQVKNIEYLNDQMGSDHCPVSLELKN